MILNYLFSFQVVGSDQSKFEVHLFWELEKRRYATNKL